MIFLIGMPGAGKTYWAQRLAERYNLSYVDMDIYIETLYQASISRLFKQHGEAWFREKEHEALKDVISANDKDTVIACGGGTPVFHGNLQLMAAVGCMVYLRAEPATLLSRLQHDENRPLLKDKDIEARLHELLRQRSIIYEQARYILDVENLTTANFAQIISSCTNRH